MLLERCEPGTHLRSLPEPEQDAVIAGLLRRLWRIPPAPNPFRPLSEMVRYWGEETRADSARWPDPGLIMEGLRLFDELSRGGAEDVLLATDLHAGNVLAAQREPPAPSDQWRSREPWCSGGRGMGGRGPSWPSRFRRDSTRTARTIDRSRAAAYNGLKGGIRGGTGRRPDLT